MLMITAIGGVGCSYVISEFQTAFCTNVANKGNDWIKHCSDPYDPRFCGSFKVIYVWNDPLLAILSHNRRNWLELQCGKLHGSIENAKNLSTLWKATANAGCDIYGIYKHAKAWSSQTRWPVFFLDLRKADLIQNQLIEFLGHKAPLMCFRARHAYDKASIPPAVVTIYRQLDADVQLMFGKFIKG